MANAKGVRNDPAQAFRFYVEITGVLAGEFLECGGLSIQRDVKVVEEGGVNDFVHILPGRIKYTNITLKRGITYSRELWTWYQTGVFDGKVKRVNMSIILGNADGKKAKQWDIRAAYPVKWTGANLSTTSTEVACETLEIAHHGIELSLEEDKPMSGSVDVSL